MKKHFAPSSLHSPYTQAVHLFTLSGFAIAYPVYEVMVSNQGFWVMYQSRWEDLFYLFASISLLWPFLIFVFLGIPTALFSLIGLKALPFLAAVWFLFTCISLQYIKHLHYAEIVISGAFALGLTFYYAISIRFREFISFMTLAALFFPLFYFFRLDLDLSYKAPSAPQCSSAKPPVIMLVFDELSLGSLLTKTRDLDKKHFPNFERLRKYSTWYRDATSNAEVTIAAVPALLTGQYPKDSSTLPTYKKHPINLFTLLAGQGYTIHAEEFTTFLCPQEINKTSIKTVTPLTRFFYLSTDAIIFWSHAVLPSSWHKELPHITNVAPPFFPLLRFTPEQQISTTIKNLKESVNTIASTEKKNHFFYLHFGLPHRPYRFYPSGVPYTDGSHMPEQYGHDIDHWQTDVTLLRSSQQRYFLQLQYADSVLGKVLDILQKSEILNEALIVVAADHGISFRSGGSLRYSIEKGRNKILSTNVALDVLKVPLFIKAPLQTASKTVDSKVMAIDVVPTVLDLLLQNFVSPFKFAGSSLVNHDALPSDRKLTVFSQLNSKPFQHKLSIFDTTYDLEEKYKALNWEQNFQPRIALHESQKKLGDLVDFALHPSLTVTRSSLPPSFTLSGNETVLPGLFKGDVALRSKDQVVLGIVFDGKIVGFTKTFSNKGKQSFHFLLPEEILVPGSHTVAVIED
jgi:phosphoglycerol transferase MdoB-like AlkP superfamily enzyme